MVQPELDNALIGESLVWGVQQRLMLQEGPLLSTDLVSPGRGLSQFVFPPGGIPQEEVLVERIHQVALTHPHLIHNLPSTSVSQTCLQFRYWGDLPATNLPAHTAWVNVSFWSIAAYFPATDA